MRKFIRNFHGLRNQAGFTLVEITASLVIIGIISSVGFQKYDQINDVASQRALEVALRDLNSRELLTWGLIKISDEGWQADEALFAQLDTQLGEGYGWSSGPGLTGGTMRFQLASLTLTRTPSTMSTVGKWEIR